MSQKRFNYNNETFMSITSVMVLSLEEFYSPSEQNDPDVLT